jgi:plastocyanin
MQARLVVASALLALSCAAQQQKQLPQQHKPGTVRGKLTSTERLITRGPLSQAELVIYLEPAKKPAKAKDKTATVNQKKLKFVPRVLPIQTGTKVTFLNEDNVTHNVFVDTDCCKLDADMEKGQKTSQAFEQAGAYPIVCRLHPEMAMTVLVVDTPWFATARWKKSKTKNAKGKRFYQAAFEIANVPPGKYTLRTWNKKLAAAEQIVEVHAGKAAELSLTLTK